MYLCKKCKSVVNYVDRNGLCDYSDGCSKKYCHRCLNRKDTTEYPSHMTCSCIEELLEENNKLKERLEAADSD